MTYEEAKSRAQHMADEEQRTCYVNCVKNFNHMEPCPGVEDVIEAWWYAEGVTLDTITPRYRTIGDVKKRNTRNGGHYFEPSTMRFFSSRVHGAIYPNSAGGAYFVTSERFDSHSRRLYTVRYADSDGRVETARNGSGFHAHKTGRAAHAEARRLAGGPLTA